MRPLHWTAEAIIAARSRSPHCSQREEEMEKRPEKEMSRGWGIGKGGHFAIKLFCAHGIFQFYSPLQWLVGGHTGLTQWHCLTVKQNSSTLKCFVWLYCGMQNLLEKGEFIVKVPTDMNEIATLSFISTFWKTGTYWQMAICISSRHGAVGWTCFCPSTFIIITMTRNHLSLQVLKQF